MRQIVLDTETTGLSVADGHRIIEIGCLEVLDRRITGRNLHFYVNPERAIDEGAMAVHGITDEMLQDKPRFAEISEEVLRFVEDSEVIIHNAPFDVGFLDAELRRLGIGATFKDHCAGVLDTLALARELHPGKRNSLDALCERYSVSNAHRKLHGALLDAELLADVYLAMTRGQETLQIALSSEGGPRGGGVAEEDWPPAALPVLAATQSEREAHDVLLRSIAGDAKGPALWERPAQV